MSWNCSMTMRKPPIAAGSDGQSPLLANATLMKTTRHACHAQAAGPVLAREELP
jgi:hypothetical protein